MTLSACPEPCFGHHRADLPPTWFLWKTVMSRVKRVVDEHHASQVVLHTNWSSLVQGVRLALSFVCRSHV